MQKELTNPIRCNIKSMIFCNLWVQNDKYDCNVLNFMGSKWISESCGTYGTHVSVRADSLRADIPSPKKSVGSGDSLYFALILQEGFLKDPLRKSSIIISCFG